MSSLSLKESMIIVNSGFPFDEKTNQVCGYYSEVLQGYSKVPRCFDRTIYGKVYVIPKDSIDSFTNKGTPLICLNMNKYGLHGTQESFYKITNYNDIRPKIRCYYVNGKRHGLYEEWYSNGRMKIKCYYIKGNLDGLYEEWYSNGGMKIRCIYKNFIPDGLYEEWYENGEIKEKTMYSQSELEEKYN